MIGNSPKVKGGITTVINQFKNYNWGKNNIKISFISSYIDSNRIHMFFFFFFSIINLLFHILLKPDYVHVHMSYKGSFFRANIIQKIVKFFNVKYIAHIHGSEFEKWYNESKNGQKKIIKNFLKKSDIVIVLGNEWKEKLLKIEKNTNIRVINNTISTKKTFAKWNKKINFVFLGVLIKRKGVNNLITAARSLVNNGYTNFSISIAGSGIEEVNLKKQIADNSLEDYICFRGWLGEEGKTKLLLNSQVMILPSYNEGLPMSILEGMSYGLPIISTKVGDIPSVVGIENGFLYSPDNISDLEKYMKVFCDMSKSEWKKMSFNSRIIIDKKFSFETYINKIINLYTKIED